MARFIVNCINKTDRPNPWERIRGLGGDGPSGRFWLTQEEVIRRIKSNETFVVTHAASTVRLVVAKSRHGNQYVKTEADGEQPNNLLSLPECE